MPSLIGSLVGLMIGLFLGAMLTIAAGIAALPFVAPFIPLALAIVGGATFVQTVSFAILLIILLYLFAYAFATAAVGPSITPAPGTPLPNIAGELFARAFMCGFTAALNLCLLFLLIPLCLVGGAPGLFCTALTLVLLAVPAWFWVGVPFAVALIHFLCAFTFVSRNPFWQVLVGWVGWISPMSYIATAIGFLLFVVNAPFALAAFGFAAFRLDFLTGVIETTGGIQATVSRATGYPGAAGLAGAYSLGNFNFVVPATAGPLTGLASQSPFTGPTLSAHEIGHSLNTSAMGGIVLWINAVDENLPPFSRGALAYGELMAESHAFQPGRTAVRIWG